MTNRRGGGEKNFGASLRYSGQGSSARFLFAERNFDGNKNSGLTNQRHLESILFLGKKFYV